ncbi:CRISPR-associated endonuclease Cas2 [Candidatus Giovannonibacteria bacterium]|nr:CRISPR-associated endonuclease Cas2 [Candidatus Giovannonibacteria bacterium]
MAGYGRLAAKLVELLANGAVLGFTRDKALRRQLLEESDHVWYGIDRKQLYVALERLKLKGVVAFIKSGDGIEKVLLTQPGRARALRYQFQNLELQKPKRWDKKWRLVLFDIPEAKKKIRDALRRKLKDLGFHEFQKSVFVCPYPCRDEINFVINFFDIADHVWYLETRLVPDYVFRKKFKLDKLK